MLVLIIAIYVIMFCIFFALSLYLLLDWDGDIMSPYLTAYFLGLIWPALIAISIILLIPLPLYYIINKIRKKR